MGKIIDSFENNIRCNFVIPGINNDGSVFDELTMCNHEYHNFIVNDYDLEKILSIYTPRYDENYIKEIFSTFKENKTKYKKIYFTQWDVTKHNHFLISVGCPYPIVGTPRTGFTIMMESIINGYSVFLVNFSLPHTEHKDFGFVEDRSMNKEASRQEVEVERNLIKEFEESGGWNGLHNTKNEVRIIKWLHEKGIIDASLCLIEDTPKLNYNLGDMKISDYMKKKIELYYV